ncbi:MAG TPA: folate-binding protein [Caulobacteraceae bacterium]|jgi:folate-binding protein YgfZ|nr:folate-binding protein [Caulobacteraceae bacterium]
MTTDPIAPKSAHLRSRALVAVWGPDCRSFLQGLLTQDVETLAVGEWRYGALLTPQGRLLFDLFLVGQPEAVLLDLPSARRHDLVQRLSLYRLRAKVEIAPAEGGVFAQWGAAAAGPGWAQDPRLPELGFRATGLTAPPAPGAAQADEDDYDAHRLALGVADTGRDALAENTYPIEANLDLLHGIDFRKGCFVGQETTSRMKRRGPVKTRLLPVSMDGPAPPPGTEVLAGALRAGEIVGGRDGRALALLRLDRIAGADLTADGRPVRTHAPDWLAGETGTAD